MFLIVDNGDGHCVSSLCKILDDRGLPFQVASPDRSYGDVATAPVDGVFLSAGDESRHIREPLRLETMALDFACLAGTGAPVLAICYGFEFLISAYGGRIHKLDSPIPDRPVAIDILTTTGIFAGLPSRAEMWEFNGLGAIDLPPFLQVTAKSRRSPIEAVKHASRPIYGTQFHPEAVVNGHSTEYGGRVIGNFIDLCLRAPREGGSIE